MTKKIGVSVIITAYNSEKYIHNMLDSLKSQSFKDFEIIVVNDGSTDNTIKIIENYSKSFDNIEIIDQKNTGCYQARINGIKQARGKYIVLLDSDDKLDNSFLEELYRKSEETKSDMTVCGFNRVEFESEKVLSREMCKHKQKVIETDLMPEEFIEINTSLWNKMFKAEILKKCERFENIPTALDDMTFLILTYLNIKKICFIDKPLYKYYVHEQSVITSMNEEKIALARNTLLEVKNRYIENKASKEMMEILSSIIFLHLIVSLMFRIFCNKECNFNEELKRNRVFLNQNFKNWDKSKYLKLLFCLKKKANIKLAIIKKIYKLGLFKLFLRLYSFMINKLKIDIKW